MRWREPVTEAINVTEARRTWSELLNRVFRREARVIVEKSGIPVAAIISMREYEFFLELKAKREERFKILDTIGERLKDVSADEIEREVAKAIAEVRAEYRARDNPAGLAIVQASQAAFRDIPDEELEREIERAISDVRRARRERAGRIT